MNKEQKHNDLLELYKAFLKSPEEQYQTLLKKLDELILIAPDDSDDEAGTVKPSTAPKPPPKPPPSGQDSGSASQSKARPRVIQSLVDSLFSQNQNKSAPLKGFHNVKLNCWINSMFQVFLRFGFSRDVVNNFKVPIVFNGTDTDATKQTLNQIRTNMISYLSDTSDSTLFDRDTSSSTSDLCRVLIDDAAHENEPETLLPYLVMIEPFYTKTKFFAAQIIENPLNPITKQIKQTEFQKLKDLGTNYPSTELSGHNSMKSVEDDHYIFFRLDEKSDTLKQLYDSYFAPTKKQKGEVSAVNDEFKMYKEMVELPELLIINMKRLKVNSKGQEYVDMRSIAVPENMTLSGYDEHQFQFKLHAFVTYQPIPAHYTSTVRDLTNPDVWHFFDDDFQDTKNLKEFWEPTTYNDVFNQEHGFFLDKASNQLNWEPKTNHGGDGRSIFFYLKDNEKRHSTL